MQNYWWNMLISLRNNQLAQKSIVIYPYKKSCESILNILWDEGFIFGYEIFNLNYFKIYLKYQKTNPLIQVLKIISKSNFKVYYSSKQLWKLKFIKGILIVSTSKGLKSLKSCKKLKLGGEPFFIIK